MNTSQEQVIEGTRINLQKSFSFPWISVLSRHVSEMVMANTDKVVYPVSTKQS